MPAIASPTGSDRWPGSARGPQYESRLAAAATGLMLLMLVAASIVIVTIQRTTMISGVDENLRQRADNLQPVDPEATVLPTEGDAEDSFAQLLDARGSVVGSSANVVGLPAAITLHSLPPGGSQLTSVHLDRPDGHFRVYIRALHRRGTGRYLMVGKNLDDVRDNVRVLVVSLAVATPIIGLLLAALAWWVVGRTLRPVQAIRSEVEDIRGDQLHRRVPVPNTDDEIAELRTHDERHARPPRVGDVATAAVRGRHVRELRTPLTRMITDVEVSLAHPDQEPSAETMQRLLGEATELQQLLNDLLYLARSSHSGLARAAVVVRGVGPRPDDRPRPAALPGCPDGRDDRDLRRSQPRRWLHPLRSAAVKLVEAAATTTGR